jgi:hypothetical protein
VPDKLQWLNSSGGPLLLLAQNLLEHWEGIDAPSGGRVVEARSRWSPDQPVTDYDRACDVTDPIANIDVGPGRGVVIAGDPDPITVVAKASGVRLVRWRLADSENQLVRHVEQPRTDSGEGWVAWIDVAPGPLVLFDAACPGPEVEDDRLIIALHPGQYVANAEELRPEEGVSFLAIDLDRAV